MLADETMLRVCTVAFWRHPVHGQPFNYSHWTALSSRRSNVGFSMKVPLESGGPCEFPGLNGKPIVKPLPSLE
ncbi:hypothetical protein [Cupriavidus taiwanensis]|uniref:Uncharacterized protein n=1 Tax=Cupriavidus taiwanensis (strain DSM 17343 / BCRC 17206 / CCUG 44338 / CIP 107171 / LMG 19424 / R1) TaxID=977880 RepID=B3R8E9_CUPTR|nr:hypothetical protein [Cupriavidus taiwanensis]CAQ71305.1 hypothetical protein RALTA_B0686 [Cupriavidus taiwanensis LMG 19424]